MNPNEASMKQLKITGQTIELFGLLSAIINGIIFVLVIIGGLQFLLLSVIYLLTTIVGVIFVIIGGKIRKDQLSKSNKSRLIVVLVISALFFIANIGGKNASSLIVPTVLVASSIIGLNAYSKLAKS